MDFVNKALAKHGKTYDYSKTIYVNSKTKVIIICKSHGEFLQSPSKHLRGQGCPKCSGNFKETTKSFIEKSNLKHGFKYDYSKTVYVNCDTKVSIICPEHGLFVQTPYAHLNSCGCIECAKKIAIINRRKYTFNEFVNRSINSHGNKYDYSKSKYVNENTKVEIICSIHGSFFQSPSEHINRKQGCKKCSSIKSRADLMHTKDSFIKEANLRHGNKYDYSKIDYYNYFSPIEIVCKKHGSFMQLPRDHINYCGCQRCGSECLISKGQQEIYDFLSGYVNVIQNDRTVIGPYEIDLYFPDINVGIEYNGLYWHSFDRKETKEEVFKHVNKLNICKENGITLINIFEDKWANNKSLVKSFLLNKIGLIKNKIYARKCEIKLVDNILFRAFCEENHIDGGIPTNVKLGLYFNGRLVIVMGFNKHYRYEWEISRLATLKGHIVVGGASRLFSKFLSEFDPMMVMTYANRCYSNGNVYDKLGFELIKITKPNYKYFKSGKMFSRQQFQKNKLKNKISVFDPNLSESQNMFNNKFRRIWDCGNLKLLWRK